MAKLFRQKSSISGLVTDLLNINTAITNEATRATGEEVRIEGLLTAETSRATASEGTLTTNLASEVSRATAAEATLTTDLASEVSRATGEEVRIEGLLTAEVSRATASEGTLTTNLASEVSRATGVEATLTTNLASEVSRATAAESTLQTNIDNINSQVSSLGSAFNYVGVLEGGVDEAGAFDLATLPATGKDTGDYYKVSLAGYFTLGASTVFANVSDGIVFNSVGGFDKIDNTNSQVFGTTDLIAVTGSSDTGFHITVDSVFVGRMSSAESDIVAEVSRATTAEAGIASDLSDAVSTLNGAIATETTRAQGAESTLTTNLASEVSRATAAEGSLDSAKMAKSANLSDVVDVASARTNIDVYSKAEVDSAISGQSNKNKNDTATIASGKIVFSKAPVGGIDGVAFGIIRIFGVDGTNPMAYDEVQIAIDSSDATGKTFTVASDVAGEYDGKSAMAFITYNPSI